MRFVLLLLTFSALAQCQSAPEALLERAREKLNAMAGRLERYVCIETVNRSYYRRVVARNAPVHPVAPSACVPNEDPGSANREPRELEFTDRIRLEVAVSQSRELHSWPGATGFDIRDVDDLIRAGPISTGSFGGYLAGIFGHPGVTFDYAGERSVEGRAALEYRYHVPRDASRLSVKVAKAWLAVPYEGEFWLEPQSLDLLRLTVRTNELPPDTPFCQAATALDYQLEHIGTGDVLLPRQSQLEIVQKGGGGKETRNDTTFDGCREYQADSEVVFEAPSDTGNTAAQRGDRGHVVLPLGLPVTLALENPIDTDTAATGDPVSARVVKPVRRPESNGDLIGAGTLVRGRIRRVEHHLFPKPYFLVAIAFNRMEVNGRAVPFAARHEADPAMAKELGANLSLQATGIWYWDVGTFLIPTTKPRYTLPAGFESKWFTLATGGL